jgi:hypothetical protein
MLSYSGAAEQSHATECSFRFASFAPADAFRYARGVSEKIRDNQSIKLENAIMKMIL